MTTYLVEFFDHGKNVRMAEWIICDDDAHAIRRARDLDVVKIGLGYNVWQGDRLVYQHRRVAR